MQLWAEPFVTLRIQSSSTCVATHLSGPMKTPTATGIGCCSHVFVFYGAAALIQQQLQTFKEFPQRQKPGAFNLERIIGTTLEAMHSGHRLELRGYPDSSFWDSPQTYRDRFLMRF